MFVDDIVVVCSISFALLGFALREDGKPALMAVRFVLLTFEVT